MSDLVVFGAGDIASLAHYYFTNDSPHRVVAFTVDAAYLRESTFEGLPVLAFEDVVRSHPPASHQMFVALSYARMNTARERKYRDARDRGSALASDVSSRCTNLAQTPVGDNCFILEDNTIQPFVTIGSNVTLWSGNHIGHHSTIHDHVFVTSHVVVSGHVTVGDHSFLGVNATIRNGITIAPRTLVGAGAAIMKDTEAGGVYLGPRATKFEKSSDEVEL